MKDNDKIYTEGIQAQGKTAKWFDNFWYHYKWHTIIISFVVVVFLICTLQMCHKESEDALVVYAGPAYISVENASEINSVLSLLLPEDFDGDGKKTAVISSYLIYSEEQMKGNIDENGNNIGISTSQNTQNYKNYYDYLMTGTSAVYMLDPILYEELLSNDRLNPLGKDENGEDIYGVRLGDTDIYKEYDVLKILPEETILCLHRQTVMGNIKKDTVYEQQSRTVQAIIDWKAE